MEILLARKLVVVSGKGGVGKTTISAALGSLAAAEGRRTIVVEVGEQSRLRGLWGAVRGAPGEETRLEGELWCTTIDPDRVLLEWVQELGGRIPGRVLASSGTFQYFAAAAPGAKELFAMVKVWELTQARRWQRRAAGYDLVVLDAPATGHALGMLGSPQTFGAIARVGPVASQAERVKGLLGDAEQSAYLAVAQGKEMAVTETLELREGLREKLDRDLTGVVVNGLLPRRFTPAELTRLGGLDGGPPRVGSEASARAGAGEVRRAAARAARAAHETGRSQHNQMARLRRQGLAVAGVPFVWTSPLDLDGLGTIAAHLRRRLYANGTGPGTG